MVSNERPCHPWGCRLNRTAEVSLSGPRGRAMVHVDECYTRFTSRLTPLRAADVPRGHPLSA